MYFFVGFLIVCAFAYLIIKPKGNTNIEIGDDFDQDHYNNMNN